MRETLYDILTQFARDRRTLNYTDLAEEYNRRTGEHRTNREWSEPLGELNNYLADRDLPALSAIVVYAGTEVPGPGFWGCSPNIPADPGTDEERKAVARSLQLLVFNTMWPRSMPA